MKCIATIEDNDISHNKFTEEDMRELIHAEIETVSTVYRKDKKESSITQLAFDDSNEIHFKSGFIEVTSPHHFTITKIYYLHIQEWKYDKDMGELRIVLK